jgi:hypothetical protein
MDAKKPVITFAAVTRVMVGTGSKMLAIAIAATIANLATSTTTALAQDVAPYCADLKRATSLASARDRFASIAGKPRRGQFTDTVLPLMGWQDCSLYGTGMYTCDSAPLKDTNEAEKAQSQIVGQLLSCFAGTWLELKDRSSPGCLAPDAKAGIHDVSIDENDNKEFVVRLILFVRGS